MNRLKGIVLAAAFIAVPAVASAQTLNFDDVNTSDCSLVPTTLPNGYQGFNWDDVLVLNGTCPAYAGLGYQAGVVSSPNVAFNGFGTLADFWSTNPFMFNSVYATGAFDNESATFNGWLGGTRLYTSTFNLLNNAPTLLTFGGWGSVDKVDFCGGACGQFTQVALDNLTVSNVTPEPATLLLLGTGLLGLGVVGVLRRTA